MNKRIDKFGDPFGPFDLNDFKKWMEHQHDAKAKPNMVGIQVESKIPYKKLISRMDVQEGDLEEVANEFEIIIVNDGSPDRSGEIADQLAAKYPFVKAIHHKTNKQLQINNLLH